MPKGGLTGLGSKEPASSRKMALGGERIRADGNGVVAEAGQPASQTAGQPPGEVASQIRD